MSLYCNVAIHFETGELGALRMPAFLAVFPILSPFMKYQESIYLTPAPSDFHVLMLIYPVYFAIVFTPLLVVALKNRNSEQNASGKG